MKQPKILFKWLALLMLTGIAVMIPAIAIAAEQVKLDGTIGVANVTADDAAYAVKANAKYNQVVKVQVSYRNTEDGNSDKLGQKVRVKIDIPTAAGKAQVIKSSIKGDNTSEVAGQATVNLEADGASLQYLPGSAVWRHNTGSANATNYIEEKVSDEVVYGAQGQVLNDAKPGDAYAATLTVLVRVMTPGVKVSKQVELKSETGKWADTNSAKPGDSLKYLISYQNTGTTAENKVIVRDSLPAHMTMVPGSTKLTNATNPNGKLLATDDVTKGGVNIGNYSAGANAYISFEATIDAADKLACGVNQLRNNGSVQPENASEFFASAATTVNRDCAADKPATPAPAPTPTQQTPPPATPAPAAAYSCDLLTVTKGDNRKIMAKIDYTAKNGAKLKTVNYNFGDGGQTLSTDKTTVDHTYAKDGEYNVSATLVINANGKDQMSTSAACAKPVSFAVTPAAPTPMPPAGTATAKSGLPNSGPGDVIGLFAAATLAGTLFHRFFLSRRFVH